MRADRIKWLVVALGAGLWTTTADSVTVDGFVKSTGGSPIQNVDLDWFNRDLNQEIDPTGDHTDATGYFSVVIPDGRYDITVFGPPSNTFAPVFLDNVDLRNSQTLADILLAAGALVTASVENESGTPLQAIRFFVEDTATGDEIFLPNDRTDISGQFQAVLPFGTHDVVTFDDSGILVPGCREDVTVAGPMSLGTFVMKPGHVVTGRVVDGVGGGIFNVDLDVVDTSTGDKVCTFSDNTDFLGVYSLFLPAGTLELRYSPAPGSPFAPERNDVVISGPATLPDQVLLTGHAVTGVITGPGGVPLVGADVNVIDVTTGVERYTPNDNTGAGGAYSVIVPVGTYDFNFNPPAGAALAAGVLWDRAIGGATALPIVQLEPGVRIFGTVRGGGLPIAGADLDVVVTGNGKTYPTPGDDTDAAGTYEVRVPVGTYDVTATAPQGSGYGSGTFAAQAITQDTQIDFDLDPVVAVGDVENGRADVFLAMHPNPFQGSVRLRLQPPADATGSLAVTVHDVSGRRVRSWSVTSVAASSLVWDGRDARGRAIPPGVYFIEMRGADWRVTQRVTRVR